MAYQRKTTDEYRLFVNYGEGDGWEHEVTEFSWRALMTQVKAYRQNCPYPIKYRKVRVKKDDNARTLGTN